MFKYITIIIVIMLIYQIFAIFKDFALFKIPRTYKGQQRNLIAFFDLMGPDMDPVISSSVKTSNVH